LCNGANGTPNLQDRFIVGAGNAYGVGATGGSANAVVVSHTHTASVSDPGHRHVFGGDDQVAQAGGYQTISGFSYDATSQLFGNGVNMLTKNTAGANAGEATGISVSNSTTGVSGTNANLPPYFALAYIMKS
jgi:hypothetical protein